MPFRRVERAWVAVPAQQGEYLDGGLARVVGHGGPTVAESLVAVERVGVVAPSVPVLVLRGVRKHAVKLDHHAVAGVPDVQVLPGHTPGYQHLTVPAQQPVLALHVTEVTQLKRRVDA